MNARRLSPQWRALGLVGIVAMGLAAARASARAPETMTPEVSPAHAAQSTTMGTMGGGGPWLPSQELIAKDGGADEHFGAALAVSGPWALVAVPERTVDGHANQGSAIFFQASSASSADDAAAGNVWTETQEVHASDGAPGDGFGNAIALSGDVALVGTLTKTISDADAPSGSLEGVVYVFENQGGVWNQTDELVAPDAQIDDLFGSSVSVGDGVAVVGAPGRLAYQGAAFVYTRQPDGDGGAHWEYQAELTGGTGQAFGAAVANVGSSLLIAAPGAPGAPLQPDCITYAFAPSSTGWSPVQNLATVQSSAGISSVTMVPGLAAIPNGTGINVYVASGSDSGADGGPWALGWTLDTGVACPNQVAMTSSTILAGCPGRSLLFTATSGAFWILAQTFAPIDTGGVTTLFGASVGVSGSTLMIGSPGTSVQGRTLQGAVDVEFPGQVSVGQGNGTVCLSTTACASGSCVGGVCCNEACTDPCSSCATGVCGGCPTGTFCNGSTCAPVQNPGSTCTTDAQCNGGPCAYGVCCTGACSGGCQTCKTGKCETVETEEVGNCGPYLCDGVDTTCPTRCNADRDCLNDNYCNDAGACVSQEEAGAPCSASGQCLGEACVDGGCQGSGAKGTPCTANEECPSNVCTRGNCFGTSPVGAPCASGVECLSGYCPDGTCHGASVIGTTCTDSSTCALGFCVDGYCCNNPCDGQCEACDVSPSPGSCAPVTGAPHGDTRQACRGAGTACAGSCQGGAGCTYTAAGTACNSTCDDAGETDYACNGDGQCEPGPLRSCENRSCADATRCRSSCTTYLDCRPGFRCDALGECLPGGSVCVDDGGSSKNVSPDAGVTDCGRYKCDPDAGACRTTCTTVTDCAPSNVCDPQERACIAYPSTATPVVGCGCRQSPAPPPHGPIALLVGGVALLGARRRRRVASH